MKRLRPVRKIGNSWFLHFSPSDVTDMKIKEDVFFDIDKLKVVKKRKK